MIELHAVNLRFAETPWVLRDVSLTVRRGEFVSLLGPSGCGKSTLLRLVAGLLEPSGGEVLLAGQPATRRHPTEQRLELVFQEPRLLPWRTVAQNIALPLELLRVPRQQQRERVDANLELIGLRPDDAHKYPRMLSGGMRMRVALARALVTEPSLLLLDEPFAALDDLLRQQLNEELLRIWQRRTTTNVFVTHNISEAVFLSQRVVIMQSHPGRVTAEVEVPFPYPRWAALRADAAFARLVGQVAELLRGQGSSASDETLAAVV